MKRCWADILGGCNEQSGEHYVGKRLFEKNVKTRGIHPNLDGRSLPVTSLEANILCGKHNSVLSVADQEAINLKQVSERMFQYQDRRDLLQGNGLWTPEQHNVNGLLFGRWLCKLHCNFLALKDVDPPEYYVRSAFGERTSPVPRFHLRAQFHDVLPYQQRIWYENFSGGPCRQDEYGTFHVFFIGFHFLVCPCDLTEVIKAKLAESTGNIFYRGAWMEKPQKICMEQDGIVVKSFVFDWGAVVD